MRNPAPGRRTGKPVRPVSLSAEEDAVLDRFVAALVARTYSDIRQATRECSAELRKLRQRLRKAGRRTHTLGFEHLYTILRKESLARGRTRFQTPYLPEEREVVERFGQAVAGGRYASAAAATDDCYAALQKLWQENPERYNADWSHPRDGVYQRLDIAVRRMATARPTTVWLPEEDKVARRFAQAVLAGRYESIAQAIPPCAAELDRAYRRRLSRSPDARVFVGRSKEGMKQRILVWMRRFGYHGPRRVPWRTAELRVVEKWARRYHSLHRPGTRLALEEVIRTMRTELEQRGLPQRTVHSYRSALTKQLRLLPPLPRPERPRSTAETRLLKATAELRKREDALIERHARGLAASTAPSISGSTRKCLRELERLRARFFKTHPAVRTAVPMRTRSTIYTYLRRQAAALGQRPLQTRWTPAEDRVLRRFARAVVEGRYHSAPSAAADCIARLARLKRPGGTRSAVTDYHYSEVSVASRICRFAKEYDQPRWASPYDARENRIIRDLAAAVVAGRYKYPLAAARVAFKQLGRYYERKRRNNPHRLSVAGGRRFDAVHSRLLVVAHELGYRGAPRKRWRPEERRIAAKWLRRFLRYLDSDSPWTREDTARLLQKDLRSRGYVRTLDACSDELALEHHGRIPESKFRD